MGHAKAGASAPDDVLYLDPTWGEPARHASEHMSTRTYVHILDTEMPSTMGKWSRASLINQSLCRTPARCCACDHLLSDILAMMIMDGPLLGQGVQAELDSAGERVSWRARTGCGRGGRPCRFSRAA